VAIFAYMVQSWPSQVIIRNLVVLQALKCVLVSYFLIVSRDRLQAMQHPVIPPFFEVWLPQIWVLIRNLEDRWLSSRMAS
jgi:hypothetical protein